MRRRKNLILLVVIFTAAIFAATASAFAASTEKVLYSFCSVSGCGDGAAPDAALIFDAAGNLYGTTSYGGNVTKCEHLGCGTVFQLSPGANGTWAEKVIHRFGSSDGAQPQGLIFDTVGNLYGTTSAGGTHNVGTVFEVSRGTKGTWTEKALFSFGGKNGISPAGELIFDGAGNLYGTTSSGGGEKGGVVFELVRGAKGAWTEKILHSDHLGVGGPGAYGPGGLTFDTAGNLYGATLGGDEGDGEIFKLTPHADGSWKQEVLHNFSPPGAPGASPPSGLIFDAAGNLYGVTWAGGTPEGGCGGSGCGVVFKLTPNGKGTWTETVLNDFNGVSGEQANAPLIFDSTGDLYGSTADGGVYGWGTVFRLDGTGETVLYNFCPLSGCADGYNPFASVIFDTAGNLYGTTAGGGANSQGTVFEITP
jgi:uncharacterized repeat protein (TIGR03803 family)